MTARRDAAGGAVGDGGSRPARRPLSPEVVEARKELLAARSGLGRELDGLTAAGQSALDIPAKICEQPVKAAALAGGAGFLLLGGPRRVVGAVGNRLFGKRKPVERGLLPDDVERILRSSEAGKDPAIRHALEEDFAEYLARKGKLEPEPSAARSFWRTYDSLIGPMGTVAARILVERLFAAGRGAAPSPPSGARAASRLVRLAALLVALAVAACSLGSPCATIPAPPLPATRLNKPPRLVRADSGRSARSADVGRTCRQKPAATGRNWSSTPDLPSKAGAVPAVIGRPEETCSHRPARQPQ